MSIVLGYLNCWTDIHVNSAVLNINKCGTFRDVKHEQVCLLLQIYSSPFSVIQATQIPVAILGVQQQFRVSIVKGQEPNDSVTDDKNKEDQAADNVRASPVNRLTAFWMTHS